MICWKSPITVDTALVTVLAHFSSDVSHGLRPGP
jgi:hypothetical protein